MLLLIEQMCEGASILALSPVKDIYLPAGEEAVLLLHSFTSNANEMRKLATGLHAKGYTCYAPNLAGHGFGPDDLFATTMADVFAGAEAAVKTLIQRGMKQIYIVGQSLGGVLALHLAKRFKECKAIGVISSPVIERPIADLAMRVQQFSNRFLTMAGIVEEEKQAFLAEHFPRPTEKLVALQQFIVEAGHKLDIVDQPIFLAKGLLDDVDFHESIDLIEASVSSHVLVKKEYPQSGHLITLGKEREQLQQDILAFLEAIKVPV